MGILAPRNTPATIVDKLNKAITKVLQLPAVRDAFVERGVTILIGKPEAFRDFIKSEVDKWTDVVKASGVQVE
jgi:tripartite-type tricarboxylate transporter receptor subunit TctC